MQRIASNNGQKIAYGLNEVETLRQSDGLSGVLYDVPMIIGPTSFDVLISTQTGNQVVAAGNDLGTNHITWGTLNQETVDRAAAPTKRAQQRRVWLRLLSLQLRRRPDQRHFAALSSLQLPDLRRQRMNYGMAGRPHFQPPARRYAR